MAPDNEAGLLIRQARTRRKLTQEELAKLLGVSRNSVNAWERGRAYPMFTGLVEEVLEITLPAAS